MKSRMPERARTDPREPWGSNPLGPPGPELPGTSRALDAEDGTDGGVGEKGLRGMGLAEIGAKNTVAVYQRRLALPKPGYVAIATF